jgi:hypothetical protein
MFSARVVIQRGSILFSALSLSQPYLRAPVQGLATWIRVSVLHTDKSLTNQARPVVK